MKGIDLSREDQSRFVVHLTRDDSGTYSSGGQSAYKNFLSILKSKKIGAYSSHCLFTPKLKELGDNSLRKRFYVSCFTETPIGQLAKLIGDKPGRRICLESYGFVFRKDAFIRSGGSPAIYVNGYSDDCGQKKSWMRLYSQWAEDPEANQPLGRILPLVNVMNDTHDFSWEREWRMIGSFEFTYPEIVAFILPKDGVVQELLDKLEKSGIPTISPGMSYEAIVDEFSKQKRRVRLLYKQLLEAPNKTDSP